MTLKPTEYGVLVFIAISGCNTDFKSELRQNGWRLTKTTCHWRIQKGGVIGDASPTGRTEKNFNTFFKLNTTSSPRISYRVIVSDYLTIQF